MGWNELAWGVGGRHDSQMDRRVDIVELAVVVLAVVLISAEGIAILQGRPTRDRWVCGVPISTVSVFPGALGLPLWWFLIRGWNY